MACNPAQDLWQATARVMTAICCGIALGSLLVPGAALAQGAPAAAAGGNVAELRAAGRHPEAAQRGLAQLLKEPWDHQLRLSVADSLQRSGRPLEAVAQLEALEGTTLADIARDRLTELRKQLMGASAGQAAAVQPSGVARAAPPAQAPAAPRGPSAPVVVAQAVPPAAGGPAATTPGGSPIQIAPFQYIPPPRPPEETPPPRTPEQQRLATLNTEGKYQELGTQGLAMLQKEQVDDELRLRIANSLSWTGRVKQAMPIYQGLLPGKYGTDARLGIANIQRWTGEDHLAAAGYRQILAAQPGNADAVLGLKLAQRELRPRTLVTLSGGTDSNDITRRAVLVNHRWRERGDMRIWEVEGVGVRDERPPLLQSASQREIAVRYTALDLKLRPSIEVSSSGQNVFGQVTLTEPSIPASVQVGRVNWGRMVVTPGALSAQLTANHLGGNAAFDTRVGRFVARADYYGISDGNTITTSSLQYTPVWRPLGPNVKPLLGIETRDAKVFSPLYWSPTTGYGSLLAGVLADWGADDWSVYASAQLGSRLWGEAGPSWSASLGGKRWLSDDWAVHANFWTLGNQRSGSPYNARTFLVGIERLW